MLTNLKGSGSKENALVGLVGAVGPVAQRQAGEELVLELHIRLPPPRHQPDRIKHRRKSNRDANKIQLRIPPRAAQRSGTWEATNEAPAAQHTLSILMRAMPANSSAAMALDEAESSRRRCRRRRRRKRAKREGSGSPAPLERDGEWPIRPSVREAEAGGGVGEDAQQELTRRNGCRTRTQTDPGGLLESREPFESRLAAESVPGPRASVISSSNRQSRLETPRASPLTLPRGPRTASTWDQGGRDFF